MRFYRKPAVRHAAVVSKQNDQPLWRVASLRSRAVPKGTQERRSNHSAAKPLKEKPSTDRSHRHSASSLSLVRGSFCPATTGGCPPTLDPYWLTRHYGRNGLQGPP